MRARYDASSSAASAAALASCESVDDGTRVAAAEAARYASALASAPGVSPARRVRVFVNARAFSESNRHDGLAVGPRRARKKDAEVRVVVALAEAFTAAGHRRPSGAVCVSMTRSDASEVDADNLPGCFKHHVDAAARYLGMDDADPRLLLRFSQAPCSKRGAEGVEIVVEWAFGAAG